jgi:hypothetical protein
MVVEVEKVGVGGCETTRIGQRFFHGLWGREEMRG